MIYTVTFTPEAEAQLTLIWVLASDKRDVTDAANWIERHLRVDADKKGVDFGTYRFLSYPPLAVHFTADPGDCLVSIFQVWRIN